MSTAPAVADMDAKELIESRSTPIPFLGCWAWTGSIQTGGYGDVRIKNKLHLAHRLSYSAFNGEIPKGYQVMHKCDNRWCVNPEHLMVGTNLDNINDSVSKGRRKGITRNRPSGLKYKPYKYSNELKVMIRNRLAVSGNKSEVAREFGVPYHVVKFAERAVL